MKVSKSILQALALLSFYSGSGTNFAGFVRAESEEDTSMESVPSDYTPPDDAVSYTFEAEVSRMLDIVVNSLYQHKEVFLREIISNSADALDKFRYLSLTEPEKVKSEPVDVVEESDDTDAPKDDLAIKILYDTAAKTLTIRDSGIGMTKKEMIENLGTVARSGTSKFMEALKESQKEGTADATLQQIGQFGVGFYSTFLVADRVSVASRHPTGDAQYVWESKNGASEFVVYVDPRGETLGRGTEITLHLKDDALEYVDPDRLRELAMHYSEFVDHPIYLRTVDTIEVPVEDEEDEETPEKKEGEDDLEVGEDEDAEPEEKEIKMKEVTTYSWDRLNSNQAIWTRDKDEISDDEYQAFYHLLSDEDFRNASKWSHFNAEGNINFKSILYLPSSLPTAYQYGNMDVVAGAVRLYVRKVLIGDEFELLPKYLGFLRGVVDSDDLPLNVNRETLQESKILTVIKKKLVRKAIDLIRTFAKESDDEMAKEDEEEEAEVGEDGEVKEPVKKEKKKNKYLEWYKLFSPNIKLGVMDDEPNRGKLMKLIRYQTTKSYGEFISLQNYIDNMKEWQDSIYVLGGASVEELERSPLLEPFVEKDVEVILMTDALDEYLVKQVTDFDGKKFVAISSENVKFKDEDEDLIKRREKAYSKKFKPLTKWMKNLFKGSVMRVQVAKRTLGSIPAVVTSSDYGNSANMERILRAQAFQHGADPMQMMSMKVFEINPRHPVVIKLLESLPDEEEGDDKEKAEVPAELVDAAWMMHDMAMLNGGFPIDNPEAHNRRLTKVLKKQFELESLKLEPEIDPPVEEDEPPEIDLEAAGGMNMEDFDLDSLNLDDLDV